MNTVEANDIKPMTTQELSDLEPEVGQHGQAQATTRARSGLRHAIRDLRNENGKMPRSRAMSEGAKGVAWQIENQSDKRDGEVRHDPASY